MSGTPIKVLSVEDNPLVGEAIGRKLSGDPGFEWLGWVCTSDALFEKVAANPPDVVCMDLEMPGQDAFEMIRALQSRSPKSRVLVLTGHVNSNYIDQAINAGAWGYLSKAEESRVIVAAFRQIAEGGFVLGKLTEGGVRTNRPAAPTPVLSESKESKGFGSVWRFLRILRPKQKN